MDVWSLQSALASATRFVPFPQLLENGGPTGPPAFPRTHTHTLSPRFFFTLHLSLSAQASQRWFLVAAAACMGTDSHGGAMLQRTVQEATSGCYTGKGGSSTHYTTLRHTQPDRLLGGLVCARQRKVQRHPSIDLMAPSFFPL